MTFVERLQERWYSDLPPPWWTRPIAALYESVVRRKMRKGSRDAERLSAPVIVVGNITAGGTGKTPLTLALVAALSARGWRPGIVSRGYGGRAAGPVLVPPDPDAALYGDEPSLMRATGAVIAIGRDRTAAARLLIDAGCNLIIADDGLQHYRLARDIEICVIDGIRRFGNGRFLPSGPLREPLSRLQSVDFRIANGGVVDNGEVCMTLQGDSAIALQDRKQTLPLHQLRGQRVHAVAAIGNPGRFFDFLRGHGIDVVEHPFPDHHRFVADDFPFAGHERVLMTSKDAVKCTAWAGAAWFEVPVVACLPDTFYDDVQAKLMARVTDS